ncbi:MAG TPA: NnrU family protein [Casimicrobiaceae bacterium]|nr:NnrU family protein [Casimicrobiaceae bacterium]
MLLLIAGVLIFLGVHSLGVAAPEWRGRQVARMGEGPWKLAYSAVSLVGLFVVIWGYGAARGNPVVLWSAPAFARHLTALLTVFAFVLVAAAYVPGTRIKAALGHPMTVGIALWALGHLLANGRLNALILFGSFLAWAVIVYVVRRRRDREAGRTYPAGGLARDAIAAVIGVVVSVVFALYLHGPLTGIRPFG